MLLYKLPHPLHVTFRGPSYLTSEELFIITYIEYFISGAFWQSRHSAPCIKGTVFGVVELCQGVVGAPGNIGISQLSWMVLRPNRH
jgi:hypothetical protein